MKPAILLPGTRVGPWRVVSRHGCGTYGTVYRVEREGHTEAGAFALKLANTPGDPRFEREAELLARIHHPHVPQLHDRGAWASEDGASSPYLVMDWVNGVLLYEWASRHCLTSRQALRLLAQVARALEATHEVGGVHRDVKGDNVLVRVEDARALLIDFGTGDVRGARRLTQETLPPGTPEYRSPEALRFQWRWRRRAAARYAAGPADDVYALGVMAYRLVTGTHPPLALPPEATEDTGVVGPARVPPEEVVRVCPELAELIRQMLSVEPSARGSAAEVAQQLEQAAETAGPEADHSITPRPPRTPTVRSALSGEPWRALTRLSLVGVALSVTLIVSAWWGLRQQVEKPHGVPLGGVEDEGSTGVGDNALPPPSASSTPAETRIGLEVPNKPFPGQRQPPCAMPGREINGGCWLIAHKVSPPCGEQFYEWRNKCYAPIHRPPRPDTSGHP